MDDTDLWGLTGFLAALGCYGALNDIVPLAIATTLIISIVAMFKLFKKK